MAYGEETLCTLMISRGDEAGGVDDSMLRILEIEKCSGEAVRIECEEGFFDEEE